MKVAQVLLWFSWLFFFPNLNAQIVFSEDGSLLAWPYKNSFLKTAKEGTNGWYMVCGSGCGFHQDGDYFAQDWIKACSPNNTCGQELLAPFSGKVVYIKKGNIGYGNDVLIQAEDNPNFVMRFAHLQDILVKIGDTVQIGELIATVGDTGNGGCHTHFALYQDILDTIPGEQQTYFDQLTRNFETRPLERRISAPFVFNAMSNFISFSPSDFRSVLYFDQKNQISGTILNQSERDTRDITLYLQTEKQNTFPSIRKEQQLELSLLPNLEQTLSFDHVFEEEGFYKIKLFYTFNEESSVCNADTLFTGFIQVTNQLTCQTLHEPNDEQQDAYLMDFKSHVTNTLEIESYFDEKPNGKLDRDYFKINIQQKGELRMASTRFIPHLKILVNNENILVEDLRKGIEISPNTQLILEATQPDNIPICVPYKILLNWTPIEKGSLFPNPNTGGFKLLMEEENKIFDVEVYNFQGEKVAQLHDIQSQSFELDIQLDLPTGAYLLVVSRFGNIKKRARFIIQ